MIDPSCLQALAGGNPSMDDERSLCAARRSETEQRSTDADLYQFGRGRWEGTVLGLPLQVPKPESYPS